MFEHRDIKARVKFLSAKDDAAKELSSSVVSVQTSKYMNQVAGSFEIRLIPQPSRGSNQTSIKQLAYLYSNAHPMDLISIGFQKPGGKMLGLVDNVFKRKTLVNRGIRREIIIKGRDFGKLLIEDNSHPSPNKKGGNAEFKERALEMLKKVGIVKTDEEARQHPFAFMFDELRVPEHFDPETGGYLGSSFHGATIEDAINFVLKSLTTLRVIVSFRGEKNVSAGKLLLRDKKIKCRPEDKLASDGLSRYTGSIANFLNQIIDKDFYELFIDSIGENAVLVVRPRPFDRIGDKITASDGSITEIKENDSFCWENLKTLITNEPYHVIKDEDILTSALGTSDYEVFTFYRHIASKELFGQILQESYGAFYPIADFAQLKRFGLRLRDSSSQLVKVFDEDSKQIIHRVLGMRDRMFNWNRYNGFLESGSITVKGNDKYRIGDRIFLKDEIAKNGERGILAYCVGVNDMYQVGTPYITNLQIIRGENEKFLKAFRKATDDFILRAK
jgi:Tfp pilus assembly protein PilZ